MCQKLSGVLNFVGGLDSIKGNWERREKNLTNVKKKISIMPFFVCVLVFRKCVKFSTIGSKRLEIFNLVFEWLFKLTLYKSW